MDKGDRMCLFYYHIYLEKLQYLKAMYSFIGYILHAHNLYKMTFSNNQGQKYLNVILFLFMMRTFKVYLTRFADSVFNLESYVGSMRVVFIVLTFVFL